MRSIKANMMLKVSNASKRGQQRVIFSPVFCSIRRGNKSKRKTLKSGQQKLSNFELFLLLFTVRLCCFLVTIVTIVVCCSEGLAERTWFFQPFDCFWFCRCFCLFVVVWCCFSFSYLRTFQLGYRALSQSNCQFWFEFRSFFVCFVLIMIELLLPNYLILNFCFANQKGQTEKGASSFVWNRKGPKLHRTV